MAYAESERHDRPESDHIPELPCITDLRLLQEHMPHRYAELDIKPAQTDVLRTSLGSLVFFRNPGRMERYLARARSAPDAPPKQSDKSLQQFSEREYVARLPAYGIKAAVNVTPYSERSILFMPDIATDENGKTLEPLQNAFALRPSDLALMQQLSLHGMTAWWARTTPSNQHLHYHALPRMFHNRELQMVQAVNRGDFDGTSLRIARKRDGTDIRYYGTIGTDPEAMVGTLRDYEISGIAADCYAAEGVLISVPVRHFKTDLFREYPYNSWKPFVFEWFPTAERMGIQFMPEQFQIRKGSLWFDGVKIDKAKFIEDYYTAIASLGWQPS